MIPKKIYQTWKNKDLAPDIQKNVDEMKAMNPDYEYQLFDDADCRNYLQTHYGDLYVMAFDELEAGAFKADLWRYAVLYREGGVYLDLDMKPLVPFNEMVGKPGLELVSVVDRKLPYLVPCAIYQAFIACRPGHPALYHALQISLYNILTARLPDTDCIDVTGPIVFGRGLNMFWKRDSETPIYPGLYDDGKTLLYKVENDLMYTYDLDGKEIIRNKVDEYVGGGYWDEEQRYYKTKIRQGRQYRVHYKEKCIKRERFVVAKTVVLTLCAAFLLYLITTSKVKAA